MTAGIFTAAASFAKSEAFSSLHNNVPFSLSLSQP
jgi:hypothetical protein